MTLDEFRDTLDAPTAPPDLGAVLEALWHDARGDWDTAHRIAQAQPGPDGAWLHAYLHRKEGDLSNAAYWYRRAGRDAPSAALDEEWRTLAAAFTSD